ncbi:MAG: DNA-binding protein [Sphingobacteriia bacterium]|nr:DNA-binding protein [Sphingobacteriia bacterium]
MQQNLILITDAQLQKIVTDAVSASQQPVSQPPAEIYLIGLQGLADHFGISVTTAWRHAKHLPKYRLGRRLMFKLSEVEQQLRQQ